LKEGELGTDLFLERLIAFLYSLSTLEAPGSSLLPSRNGDLALALLPDFSEEIHWTPPWLSYPVKVS
jgi:hypothetical protein